MATSARAEKVFLIWLAVGVVGRVIVARSAWGATDSDEATGILMASRAAHDQFFSLFWGGSYGGTLSTWIDAPFVRVFGLHVWVFRTTSIVFALIATVLLRLVAAKLVSRRAAIAAAVLFWVAPPDWVRWSMHEYVFWVPGICVALGAVLCALRWNGSRHDRRLWPIGLLAGASFWMYLPLVALVAPAVVGVAWALRRRPVGLLKLVALAPVGALPWLYASVTQNFVTLNRSQVPSETIAHRLVHTITHVLPSSLLTSTGLQPSARTLSIVGIVILLAVAGFVVRQVLQRRFLLALAGTSVFLWAILIAASGVDVSAGSYRYAFILVPVLALLVAYLADQVRVTMVVPVVAAAVTAYGGAQATANWASAPAYDPHLVAVTSFLVDQHRPHVYAGYWVSYVLSVASDERVTASPTFTMRDEKYEDLATAAPRTTYVFEAGLGLDQEMTAWTRAHHLGQRFAVGGYAVWEFPTSIPPGTIPLNSVY
ncbi:MAG: hypothetical protein M3Y36_01695 [Actinomycetota bacterium]|nr:hypothetical protein [Actinomycetota bacterium]